MQYYNSSYIIERQLNFVTVTTKTSLYHGGLLLQTPSDLRVIFVLVYPRPLYLWHPLCVGWSVAPFH